mmetsp:Transcript_60287/g.152881  ORF Transcript_60287/g.152881 Transcript_60287/m.152881 type:complete len:265 (-) Transcript_60287:1906-2700(-)
MVPLDIPAEAGSDAPEGHQLHLAQDVIRIDAIPTWRKRRLLQRRHHREEADVAEIEDERGHQGPGLKALVFDPKLPWVGDEDEQSQQRHDDLEHHLDQVGRVLQMEHRSTPEVSQLVHELIRAASWDHSFPKHLIPHARQPRQDNLPHLVGAPQQDVRLLLQEKARVHQVPQHLAWRAAHADVNAVVSQVVHGVEPAVRLEQVLAACLCCACVVDTLNGTRQQQSHVLHPTPDSVGQIDETHPTTALTVNEETQKEHRQERETL